MTQILTELLPQRRPDFEPGDLVQISGHTNDAYAGLPALIRKRHTYAGNPVFDCSPLAPHRGGMTWRYSVTDLVALPKLPTPVHKWMGDMELGRWAQEFLAPKARLDQLAQEIQTSLRKKPPARVTRTARADSFRDKAG